MSTGGGSPRSSTKKKRRKNNSWKPYSYVPPAAEPTRLRPHPSTLPRLLPSRVHSLRYFVPSILLPPFICRSNTCTNMLPSPPSRSPRRLTVSEKMKLEEKESRQDAQRESQKDRLPRNRFGTCSERWRSMHSGSCVCVVSSGGWGGGVSVVEAERATATNHACRVLPREGSLTVPTAVRARLLMHAFLPTVEPPSDTRSPSVSPPPAGRSSCSPLSGVMRRMLTHSRAPNFPLYPLFSPRLPHRIPSSHNLCALPSLLPLPTFPPSFPPPPHAPIAGHIPKGTCVEDFRPDAPKNSTQFVIGEWTKFRSDSMKKQARDRNATITTLSKNSHRLTSDRDVGSKRSMGSGRTLFAAGLGARRPTAAEAAHEAITLEMSMVLTEGIRARLSGLSYGSREVRGA